MELSTLRLFTDVMHRRNFAAVARDHGLAPSSVSRSIAALEEELGIKLFQRSTRQLEPTEAGVDYFDRIEVLVDQLEQAQYLTQQWNGQPKGTLRITMPVTFGQIAIVPLLPEFKQHYPDLTVEVLMTDAIVDLVAERIDIAIRLGSLPDSKFIAKRLCSIEFVACASPNYLSQKGHPKTPQQIQNHECILWPLPGFSTHWNFRESKSRNKKQDIIDVPVQGHYRISNSHALKQCAVAGMGIALLTKMVAKKELDDGSLINLFPELDVSATDFDNPAWLVYPSRDYLPLKVKLMVDFLQEKF
ncbi:Transcriptional regulator, LysR family [hydrothermal vent metagenome]|uniref:Transcriptional regulator, LysR family n=1 Tax=hydrothermal vent metagenome TaxID=652676 RepID=A0A3B0ZPP0_9ZZZZ